MQNTVVSSNCKTGSLYLKDGIEYAIQNQHAMDKVTPYWVYYNSKLVSKFTDKETAKTYIKVLMRN
jgi:hypothetical protein